MNESYLNFLKSKVPQAEALGFDPPSEADDSLFGHQVDIATWALKGGRRAVFASFGLGKTRMHLQLAKWICEKVPGGRYLIVAPLGVRQEFTLSDGPAMGLDVCYIRTTAEATEPGIYITNYEPVRDGKIDVAHFDGAGLDESSVLRSFGSKTYQNFLTLFRAVKYRFVFTATPSPNRHKELIHYAGFLGVMDTGEALTRFFQRDSTKANQLTLYPHMEAQFWMWLASWSVFIQKPSDLGYSDEGYDLPPVQVHWHKVNVDHSEAWSQTDSWGQSQLIQDQSQGLKQSAETKRGSIDLRLAEAERIMAEEGPERHWLLWHDLEAERHAIGKRDIPGCKAVWGSMDLEKREGLIMDFASGKYRVLATKPVIAGSGCNFQRHCADAIFLGVGYKFNDFIQAVHRIYRFQQARQVHIHIIYLESEESIKQSLELKWRQHEELVEKMTEILRKYKLANISTMELQRTLGCERIEARGEVFRAVRNDCVEELALMEDNSVDLICTSIPFGNQYEYSPSYNDFGHNTGDDPFFEQMGFLCPELLRVLRPGRIAAIHVKDRILFGNVTGHGCPTVNPFSDKTTAAFLAAGFVLMARITVDTDVVRENNQTYRLGWSENAKDSSKMGAGMPEYVLVLRKLPSDLSNAYADVPVTKSKEDYTLADWQLDAAGLWRSNGDRLIDPELLENIPHDEIKRRWIEHSLSGGYDHQEHVELAKLLEDKGKLPASFMLFPPISRQKDIWTDIARMRTLNSEQSRRNEQNHVCPLQLDIIKRIITRYSNPGEIVFDPFLGIGSTAWQAIKMGRQGWGVELNEEYWRCAAGYCESAEAQINVPSLFDLAECIEAADTAEPVAEGASA